MSFSSSTSPIIITSPLYFAGCPDGLNAHACRRIIDIVENNTDNLFPSSDFSVAVYFNIPTLCPRNAIAFRLIDKNKNKKNQSSSSPSSFSFASDSTFLSNEQLKCFLNHIRTLDWVMVCMHSAPEMLSLYVLNSSSSSSSSTSTPVINSQTCDDYFRRKLYSNDNVNDDKKTTTTATHHDHGLDIISAGEFGDSLQSTTLQEIIIDKEGHAVKNSALFPKRRKDAQVTKGGPLSVNETFTENEVLALKAVREKVILPFIGSKNNNNNNNDDDRDAASLSNDNDDNNSSNLANADNIAVDRNVQDLFKKKLRTLTEECIRKYDLGELVSRYFACNNNEEQDFSVVSTKNNDDDDHDSPIITTPKMTKENFIPPLLLCRVSGERNDKRQNYVSVELAKVFADFVVLNNFPAWQASMRFFHVEFLVVSDVECCIAGLVLHPPNPPRYDPPSSSNHIRLKKMQQQQQQKEEKKENKNDNEDDKSNRQEVIIKNDDAAAEAQEKKQQQQQTMFQIQGSMEKTRVNESHNLAKLKYQDMLIDRENTRSNQQQNPSSLSSKYSSTFTAKCPPPAHFRGDIRSVRSEKCNMHQGIAEFMCELAKIESDDIVMDPMGGAGTIGLEAIIRGMFFDASSSANNDSSTVTKKDSTTTKKSHHHGRLPLAVFTGDIEHGDAVVQRANFDKDSVLEAASTMSGSDSSWISSSSSSSNTSSSSSSSSQIQIIKEERRKLLTFGLQRCAAGCGINWDATRLPLRDQVIDVIISDLPFGHRCGNKKMNQKLYPAFLREFHRVLRNKNGRAVLLTLERGLMCETLEKLNYASLDDINNNNSNENNDEHRANNNRRPAHPREKEDVLKQEEDEKLDDPSTSSRKKPLWIKERQEFPIDMGGLLPYCFVLRKNI